MKVRERSAEHEAPAGGRGDIGREQTVRREERGPDKRTGTGWLMSPLGGMRQPTPCVHKGAGEGALRAPFEPPPSGVRPLAAARTTDGPRHRARCRLGAGDARSLHAGPRQRLRRPPLRSGPPGDADRRSGILACTAGRDPAGLGSSPGP